MDRSVFVLFLSLYPLLGKSCSCVDESNRFETLRNGVCYGDAYTGVVLEATCTCLEGTAAEGSATFDCRKFSYSEKDNTYSAEVIRRVELRGNFDGFTSHYIKTCPKAEDTLAPDATFQYAGVEPNVTTENDTSPIVCPFNDNNSTSYLIDGFVCVYRVRVTEVFVGNFSVGDVITSAGPDAGTSCSPEEGRILQLRTEYLAGVGGPCTPLIDWDLLSKYSEKDLETLRELAKTRDPETCSSYSLRAVAVAVLLTAGLLSLLMY